MTEQKENQAENPTAKKDHSTGWIVLIVVTVVIGVIAIIGLLFGGWYISKSNSLTREYQAVQAQYAQVDTVLQRRADLIPNLANSVKGSMHNEQKIFGDIAKARSSFQNAKSAKDRFKASNEMDKSKNILVNAIKENYPDLNSDKRVHDLMVEIEGSESRISTERQNYNRVVQQYNSDVTTFPGNMFHRSQVAYFEAEKNARKAPTVDLDK